MKADPKERAEHVMLVDLGATTSGAWLSWGREGDGVHGDRALLARHAPGESRDRPAPRGGRRFDVLRACFPAGTVSGRTQDPRDGIIDEIEADAFAAPTRARWATWRIPATSTPASRSGRSFLPWHPRLRPGSAPASSPTPIRRPSGSRPAPRRAPHLALRMAAARPRIMILVIDNYDSFTYNLVRTSASWGRAARRAHDAVDSDGVVALHPERIVISPGPGTPDDAGVSLDVIRRLGEHTPILGVCLGHQAIGQAIRGHGGRAKAQMHGKTSDIRHDGRGGVRRPCRIPLTATRYHSLGDPAPHGARGPRGHGVGGGRRDHGRASPPLAGGGRAVPPGVHPHVRGEAAARQLPGRAAVAP